MLMPAQKARKTKHTSLTPKHKHTKEYVKVYWPYLPLMMIVMLILAIWQPWQRTFFNKGVLPYATSVSVTSLLDATNNQRLANGGSALALNNELSQAAQAKAYDMAAHDYWSHTSPDGSAPWMFITNAGYEYKKAGENLAYGFVTSTDVVNGWMNSPSHKQNLLDGNYKDVGFGFVDSPNFDGNGPATVVVAMYGQPAHDEAPVVAQTAVNPPAQSFSTLGNYTGEPVPQTISKIQTFTRGLTPWAQYAIGIIIGAVAMYLLIKHSLQLRRAFAKGERFVVHHPLLDVTLVALLVLGFMVVQRVGVIL